MKKQRINADLSIQMIVIMAMMVALQIVLSRFLSINTPVNKIGFAFVPIAITGMLFGPVSGLIVAVVADVLGAMLFPSGPFFPGFTLTAALTGLTYGLLLYNRKSYKSGVVRVVIAVLFIQLVLGLGLNSLWISMLYGNPYVATVVRRLVQVAILIPVEIIVNCLLLKISDQLLRYVNPAKTRVAAKPVVVVNGEPRTDLSENDERR